MDEPGSVCGPRSEEQRGGLEASCKSASVWRVRTRSLQRLEEFPERERRNPNCVVPWKSVQGGEPGLP